jgi:uncharacterized protein DUF3276
MIKRHNEIFNEEVQAGRRTYFFDVKINKDNQKYLKITESKRTDHGYEHRRIMIFEEHFEDFFEGFEIIKEYLNRCIRKSKDKNGEEAES